MTGKSRQKLYADFKKFLANLQKNGWLNEYELFRGDSFQCSVEKKETTLRVSLIIRSFIKSYISLEHKEQYKKTAEINQSVSKGYFPGKQDIRLGIGIGKFDFIKKGDLSHSDGQVFQLSGETLDSLKKFPFRMMVKTSDNKFNASVEPSILLLDAVIQKWTNTQAETVLLKLENLKEEEIARKLKISQSAVNQRTKTAQWYAIEKLIVYFEDTLKEWK